MQDQELLRLKAMSIFERNLTAKGFQSIAGVDEAGRGPLAGPVVAAACILPEGIVFEYLNDSKQLSANQREILYEQITSHPDVLYGVGIADVETIDRINILQATWVAMRYAVQALPIPPDYLLIDGNQSPGINIPMETLVAGDARSISIAAASVIAKVTRDRIMAEAHHKWPQYEFKNNKGYGTGQHLDALQKCGPCIFHRTSFEPIRSMLYADVQISLFPYE